MSIDIYSMRNSIKNLIDKNNTTTSSYDVSNGLIKRVQAIYGGYHIDKPIPDFVYPCVWVELKGKEESFPFAGNQAKRNALLKFEVVAIVQDGLAQTNGREVSDDQMLKLSSNIENLFRNYINLSMPSSVLQSIITNTEYDVGESNNTYNSIAKISIDVTARG